MTQNVEFQEQVHLGFYCPKTKQKLLSLENLDDKEDVSIATESTGKETIGTTFEPYPLKSIQEEEERSKDTINDVVATSEEASSRSKSAKELKDLNPIPTEISTFASSPSNDPNANSMDPILDLESLGPILVAIPKDYKMRQIIKQVDKILESPAFRLLTANSLEQAGNMTVAQELEQLKQQSLTTNVAIYLNEQVTQNQQATAFYEEQQLDLEKRRISPKATIPDAHGLSPLDAMRVAQNQQKAAARQQEKTTLQQYQKHLDTLVVDTSMATTSTTTTGELSTPEVQALITPSLGTTNQDIPSPNSEEIVNRNNQSSPSINELPGMFVSSSLARRQSLEQQKQAELDAIRKQGLAQTKMNAAYFASQETTAKARRESYQEQTKAELASLSNLNLQKSWRDITSLSSLPQPVSPKIQSNHSVKMIVTTAPTSANNGNATTQPELEDLRRQGLTKVMSLQQIPVLVRSAFDECMYGSIPCQ